MRGRNLVLLAGGVLALVLPFAVYLATLSPTLNFWDCGEFIATSYILGIPHPPATPMYVLVGRLASILPSGLSVAAKLNAMSALFGALASLMMYLLVLKVTNHWRLGGGSFPDWLRAAGALAAAFFIAFSSTFWFNAIEAEVYALAAFFMGAVLWLMLDWGEHARNPRGNALVYLILYLLSLGVGFHLGTILIFPGFFVLALLLREKSFSDLELWLVALALALFLGSAILHMPDGVMLTGLLIILLLGVLLYTGKMGAGPAVETAGKRGRGAASTSRRPFVLASLGLFLLGLSVHLFLLIRAGQNPSINEADPSTWSNLWAVLKREQYPFQLPTDRKAPLGWQFSHFFNYFWDQFRMPPESRVGPLHLGRALTALPIGLGLLGIWYQLKRDRLRWWPLITVLLVNTVGLVFFLNFSADEVRERDYFYAAGFYFYALFIGLGAVGLLEALFTEPRGRVAASVAAPLLLLASLGPLQHHWRTHDRSENFIARDYAYNMLAPLAPDAVVFTNGDNDTFPLWYIQEVEGFRKDIRVVNLSLLNTDWYMRQLRDVDPTLPITYTNAQIDEVATHYYRMDDGSIMQPRDEIINHMFLNTQRGPGGWERRPYYFAVTIPRETLRPFLPYLVMEGMVYRMTLKAGEDQVDVATLERNLTRIFEWRGLLTKGKSTVERERPWAESQTLPSVLNQVASPGDAALDLPDFYKDPTILHLIQNYAAAWARLAIEMDKLPPEQGGPDMAVRSMEMARLIREDLRPVILYLGYLYSKNGQPERAMTTYEHYLSFEPDNWQLWARYAQACEMAGRNDKVVEALVRLIDINPDYEAAYASLIDYVVNYFPDPQNLAMVQRRVSEYLARRPNNPGLEGRLRLLNEYLAGQGSAPSPEPAP